MDSNKSMVLYPAGNAQQKSNLCWQRLPAEEHLIRALVHHFTPISGPLPDLCVPVKTARPVDTQRVAQAGAFLYLNQQKRELVRKVQCLVQRSYPERKHILA